MISIILDHFYHFLQAILSHTTHSNSSLLSPHICFDSSGNPEGNILISYHPKLWSAAPDTCLPLLIVFRSYYTHISAIHRFHRGRKSSLSTKCGLGFAFTNIGHLESPVHTSRANFKYALYRNSPRQLVSDTTHYFHHPSTR